MSKTVSNYYLFYSLGGINHETYNLRSAAVLGTVGFAGFLLAACSNGSSGSSEASKEINVYVDKGYKSYVEEAAKAFEKENGVKLTSRLVMLLVDWITFLLITNLKAPDVMMAPYDRVGGLGSDGQLAEVTLNKDSHTDKTTEALVTNGGKVYGAPAVIETLVLYYNKDLLSEAPKTFGDLENLAKDSKYDFASEPGKTTAFLADWTNFYYTYGLLSGNGGYVFGKDGTDPKDIGLNNQGSIDGIEYAKLGMLNGQKVCKIQKLLTSSKHNSKKVKQLLSSMVLGKLLH